MKKNDEIIQYTKMYVTFSRIFFMKQETIEKSRNLRTNNHRKSCIKVAVFYMNLIF